MQHRIARRRLRRRSVLKDTYHQLMDKWFGNPLRVHIDSWIELGIIDGHQIILGPEPADDAKKLFFINLGAYLPGQFTELHANTFVIAESERQVKLRAKGELLRGTQQLHTDDLYDVDDCLEIAEVDGYHVHLEPTRETRPFEPSNGYHVIPKPVVADYAKSRNLVSQETHLKPT